MSGVGRNLRESDINIPADAQTAIFGTAFDPVAAPCAVIELSQSWCPPCRKLIPHLIKMQDKYKHVKMLQISPEPPAKLKTMFKEHTPSYTVSSVANEVWEEFSEVLGVQGIPHACVLDAGKIVFSGNPADPKFVALVADLEKKYGPKKKFKGFGTIFWSFWNWLCTLVGGLFDTKRSSGVDDV